MTTRFVRLPPIGPAYGDHACVHRDCRRSVTPQRWSFVLRTVASSNARSLPTKCWARDHFMLATLSFVGSTWNCIHWRCCRSKAAVRSSTGLGYTDLPVQEVLGKVLDGVEETPFAVILSAPPGAGKTTGVPLELLRDGRLPEGVIVVTQPRRVAARSAAKRIAALCGEAVGERTVGYQIRFDRRVSPQRNRIDVVTDGVLVRKLQADMALPDVAAIILDEFHERSALSDVALTLCLHARSVRHASGMPPLRIIVMSATLTASMVQRLDDLLGGASVVSSPGRAFNVQTQYTNPNRFLLRAEKGFEVRGNLEKEMAKSVRTALEKTDGDVLCFLPGEGEIKRTAREVLAQLPKERKKGAKEKKHRGFGAAPTRQTFGPIDVLPLHGSLDSDAQDLAVLPGPAGRRRVILATNIAEASITVAGVTAVVDGGLRRRSRFDPSRGFDSLELAAISKASADQRTGRAGRLRDGLCFRVWSKTERMRDDDLPEIALVDLTSIILFLLSCDIPLTAITELPWLDRPPPKSVDHAVNLLRMLGAVDDSLSITEHGCTMAALPLHPRLAHMALVSASIVPCAADSHEPVSVASLCALLELEQDILKRSKGSGPVAPACADLRLRMQALHEGDVVLSNSGKAPMDVSVVGKRCVQVHQAARQLRQVMPKFSAQMADLGALVAAAFPERVARSTDTLGRFVMRDGTVCSVADVSLRKKPLLAIARLHKSDVTLAAPLSAGAAATTVLGNI